MNPHQDLPKKMRAVANQLEAAFAQIGGGAEQPGQRPSGQSLAALEAALKEFENQGMNLSLNAREKEDGREPKDEPASCCRPVEDLKKRQMDSEKADGDPEPPPEEPPQGARGV
jgi:hypothetical protein